jgi:hypothetical protein
VSGQRFHWLLLAANCIILPGLKPRPQGDGFQSGFPNRWFFDTKPSASMRLAAIGAAAGRGADIAAILGSTEKQMNLVQLA